MTKALTKTQGNELKSSTETKLFKPSAGMKVWLAKSMEIEGSTISDIAIACGMDRSSWYKWLELPGFIEWYNEEWNKKLKSYSQRLDLIGMQNSRKDFNYWKEMQKRVGNIQEDKNMIAVQSNVSFSDDQLKRLMED